MSHALGKMFGAFATLFLEAWFAMLLLGAAHSSDQRIPALGYGVTLTLLIVALAATLAIKALTSE